MVVTIQKELADRITARPSTKDYSALSVWIQSQCDADVVRVMPPTVFWPRPKVHSAIIRIIPRPEKRARIPQPEFFHTFRAKPLPASSEIPAQWPGQRLQARVGQGGDRHHLWPTVRSSSRGAG